MEKSKYSIRELIFFDECTAEQKKKLEEMGLKVASFNKLLIYEAKERPKVGINQTLSYLFMSGSTGISKGVVYRHRNVLCGILSSLVSIC